MNNKLTWKVILLLVLTIGVCWKLYPNLVWYSYPLKERQEQAKRKNPLAQQVVPLGLDLQGGVHLVYQLDVSKLPDASDATVTRAIEQNMVVITNRIDALGVANPFVARQGKEFVVIQLPGVYESEQAKNIIGKTALLEFRIVRESDSMVTILQEIEKRGIQPEDVINEKLPEDIKKLIPAGMDLMPERGGGYLLVNDKPDLTGQYLKEARVEVGQVSRAGGIAIGFELNATGASIFEALTRAHLNDRLGIVLDRQIQSAPTIQSPIPGGRGQITGSFSDEEAKTLANILNSGNLQAPMKVVEERTVGPELGEDSIRGGLLSSLVAFGFVIVFMIILYKWSGVLADIALVLNLLFLMAILSWLSATLTLPGIAGIILSLAMAVDANVLILERVHEELARGKQARHAVDEGYAKAFSAIFDGNLTTILAGAFLFQFGTGPIKGFGITLIWGLVISMATAIWVTKLSYEIYFSYFNGKTVSV